MNDPNHFLEGFIGFKWSTFKNHTAHWDRTCNQWWEVSRYIYFKILLLIFLLHCSRKTYHTIHGSQLNQWFFYPLCRNRVYETLFFQRVVFMLRLAELLLANKYFNLNFSQEGSLCLHIVLSHQNKSWARGFVISFLTQVENVHHGLHPECVIQRYHCHGVSVAGELWDHPLWPAEGDTATRLNSCPPSLIIQTLETCTLWSTLSYV